MIELRSDRFFPLVFRLLMAWTFLYAASSQVLNPMFSFAGLLRNTKTFHNFFAVFATAEVIPVITFLVAWGHLLIGLSLLVGLFVRVSAAFGIALVLLYWIALMDWPYIDDPTNFIIDFHIVYAVVLGYLIAMRAGHAWGLDGWAAKLPFFERNPKLKILVA
jgi:thiosulfate dehydrogenase (quinone) large subunit